MSHAATDPHLPAGALPPTAGPSDITCTTSTCSLPTSTPRSPSTSDGSTLTSRGTAATPAPATSSSRSASARCTCMTRLPRDLGRNAVHHLGIQVVGLEDLYARMEQAGLDLRNPIRVTGGSKYFMLAAPDNVLLELFEPGAGREPEARAYYGFDA